MKTGERIKELRKSLGMTQGELGKKIGLTSSAISYIESGKATLTDQNILSIVREFGVNEIWLRTGVGEMHKASTWQEEVTAYLKKLVTGNRSELEETIIRFMAATKPDDWEKLAEVMRKFIADEKKKTEE